MVQPYEPISQLDWSGSTYIEDGVYAHTRNEYLWLRTDRGTTPHVIALDYHVLESLVRYLFRTFPEEAEEVFQKVRGDRAG